MLLGISLGGEGVKEKSQNAAELEKEGVRKDGEGGRRWCGEWCGGRGCSGNLPHRY